ncbi:hypothetical protein Mgra_00002829, partial [Meloidogyne graminicola]
MTVLLISIIFLILLINCFSCFPSKLKTIKEGIDEYDQGSYEADSEHSEDSNRPSNFSEDDGIDHRERQLQQTFNYNYNKAFGNNNNTIKII